MFVIPMAGLSKRFFDAGYKIPKYMLKIGDTSVFENSIRSFEGYFDSDLFIFIIRDEFGTKDFVESEVKKCRIKNYRVITLNRETSGQGESVALGLAAIEDDLMNEELYVFNIDTFRPGFEKPEWDEIPGGYLETFIGKGKNWSNVEPISKCSDLVKRTAEKQEISEYCCTGLYFWKTASLFKSCFSKYYIDINSIKEVNETYIAPVYNFLIENSGIVRFTVIPNNQVIFCGTPIEYLECCNDR